MTWYFTVKLLAVVCLILFYVEDSLAWRTAIAILLVIDALVVPVVYLVSRFIRRRKQSPKKHNDFVEWSRIN